MLISMIQGIPKDRLLLLAVFCVGVYILSRLFLQLLKSIWTVFLRPGKDLRAYGSWAIVTGASDGIGKAFCEQLAQKGINIVLVGRNEQKLRDLAGEIRNSCKVSTKHVVVDFADDKLEAGLERISKAIEGLDVGILINNVGVSYPYARFLHEVEKDLLEDLVRVNIVATTRMCQILIPDMLKKSKGAILNIGSGSGSILPADPLYSVYAASKSYVEVLSKCMYVEYKHKGIDVQCQVPLYVKTKMAKIRKASLTVPTPELYVKSALRSIGYEPVSTPYWAHSMLWWLISVVPQFVVDAVRLKSNLDLRRRGQLKAAKTI